ncbi:helix-turn-helix domain-containing protein [Oceanobacillus halotolerans]|uniref:helix-turn-helix domain-containing protein n=1 Tax=Oceanobacillus halotolerans TaxID=2663380 RepID=UPI0013DC6CAE|nr:helix-turn-helix domain-containing protein [Oceanobacillus halotolerans]
MENDQKFGIDKAEKLLKINKMLTESLQQEEVLRKVIVAASELIDVSDTLILYLYDQSTKKLKLAEGEGINKEKLQHVAFEPGESIAGKVFKGKKPKLFTSEDEIDLYMRNMATDNYYYYFEGVYRRKIKSAFCVPLLNRGECLGVLVVNNFNQDGVFTKSDMRVIEFVADQSAIAINNSHVYRNLEEKNELLSQSIAIHDEFYSLIIKGGGMKKVIHLLESVLQGKVTFHAITFYKDAESIFPIVRGDEVLGILELEKPFHSYSQMEQVAIEQASLSIALELVKENALFEKELHFREEVFNQLLESLSQEDMTRLLEYINWDEKWRLQCIIIESKNGVLWEKKKITDKERFIKSIEAITKKISSHSLVFTKAYQIILIIPQTKENTVQRVISSIDDQWIGEKQLIYGVGRETSIHHLDVTYREAMRSVSFAKSNQAMNVVEYAKLGIERLLYEADSETIELFMEDKLGGLFKLDQSYLKTVNKLIENNKNHKQTSQDLHIHPNTLYYRLRKIEEVLSIDLSNERDWLNLVIALQLFRGKQQK